ncbi:MAG: VIT domain-containing protein [Candidatus Altiarchaeota archaeon]
MKATYKIGLILVLFTLCINVVRADGIIIPEPPYPQPMPPDYPYKIPYLAIKYHHVDVVIDNQYATTKIDQVFVNNQRRELEGTYIFPLPEEATISKFSMYVDGEELIGEILEKQKARQIYEDIVRRMKDPALLEYVGRNMFKARVYPIPALGEKRIKLDYEEMVKCESGICRYVYPLSTEKFSSKKLETVRVTVTVKSKSPIKTVYSPTHEVKVKWQGEHEVEVTYKDENALPKNDFELIYTISEEDFGINLLTHRLSGEDGYFTVLIAPSIEAGQDRVIPKDVLLVLDTSGSMSGEKIKQAKEALKFTVNSLNDVDKFNIITFSSEVRKWRSGLVEVNEENIESAVDFIEDIKAAGGTNINDALQDALDMSKKDTGRMQTLIFLTDGKPTVGTTNIERILETVRSENDAGSRFFVFGVGYDVNTHLLDKLVEENSGASEYVKPDEDIEVKVSALYKRISAPVLSDLELDFGDIDVEYIYPKNLPDIFRGSQIMVFGRYSGSGDATITLKGNVAGIKETHYFETYFAKVDRGNDFIPRLWATRRIGFLLDEIRLHGVDDELKDEIIELSLKYGIMTPYTSFLVTEDTDYTAPVTTGGERPAPMMQEARSSFGKVLDALSYASDSGAGAVNAAMKTASIKETEYIEEDKTGKIETAGEKTFYMRKDVWVDQGYNPEVEAIEIKYDSDAYFQLLDEGDDVGQYLAKGKNVDFCLRGSCFNIREDAGAEKVEAGRIAIPDPVPEDTTTSTIRIEPPIRPGGEQTYQAIVFLIAILVGILAVVAALKMRK